jgi:HlyD family secretion protein
MKKYIVIAVVILCVGGVGYYFFGFNRKVEAVPVGQVQRILKISKGNLTLTVSANGVVQPISKIDIKSKASGIVQQLTFVEGSHVKQGDLLIQTDTVITRNNYDQAVSDVASAEAALTQSQNNYKRTTELFSKGLASQQEVDQANVDLVRTKSSLQRTQAALSTNADALRDCKVKAPITGTILSRSVEVGTIIASAVSNVGGGTTLATIADMDTVNVETNVDEVDIGKVREGLRANVKADAFPDDVFPGEVIRISPLGKTQQNVTVFTVLIQVANIAEKLKAGMSTSVDIEVFNRRDIVLVPNEGLKDPRTEQGRAIMAANNLSIPRDSTQMTPSGQKSDTSKVASGEDSIDKLREKMRSASPEERQALQQQIRDRFEKMPEAERQKYFEQMRARFSQGGGGGRDGGGGFGGGGMFGGGGQSGEGQRIRRTPQAANTNEPKWRIVTVKDGNEFKAKLIKVGPSNFDYSEVLDGLKEGDEIQVTTISRAKIASEQMVDRMRQSSSPLGGGGGGGGMRGGH